MVQSQADLESVTTDLTAKAFAAFAEDISTTFDTVVSVEQLDIAAGTANELKKTYKKLAVVCSVKAEGAVNGQFHVVFDTEGFFTLAGTFAMQPEEIIKQNRKTGTDAEANEIANAVAEVGNLMVGAWDKVFREEMPDHKHLVPSGTFMGNPWTKSEEKIGLAADTELAIVTFEMTIDPLPAFKCAAIYPKSLFGPSQEAGSGAETAEEETPLDKAPADQAPAEPTAAEATKEEPSGAEAADEQPAAETATVEDDTTDESADQAPVAQASEEDSAAETATPEPTAEDKAAAKETTEEQAASQEAPDEEDKTDQPAAEGSAAEEPDTEPATQEANKEEPSGAESGAEQAKTQDEQKEVAEETEQAQTGPVTDAIAKMKDSPAVLPGQFADSAAILTGLTAKDVMTANVVWAGPDETVEQLTAKMQQNDTAYLLIGQNEQLQGIVSKSDIRGAQSPYLHSMFAKWRTPMDIATLQIKAQWVMSRPVRTVRPDTTLAQVMQAMTEHGGRCMPVTDEAGKVQGIVTVFDIFSALLVSGQGISTAGEAAQTPPVA